MPLLGGAVRFSCPHVKEHDRRSDTPIYHLPFNYARRPPRGAKLRKNPSVYGGFRMKQMIV